MVLISYFISLLSILISRKNIKNDATWGGVVRHLKFETIFILFSLKLRNLKVGT